MPYSHARPLRTALWIFCAILWTGAGALAAAGTVFHENHIVMLWGIQLTILAALLTAYLTVSHAIATLLAHERSTYSEIAEFVAKKALDQIRDDPRFDGDDGDDDDRVTRIR